MGFERRKLGRSGFALVSTTLERHGVLAAFSERSGGASRPPYAALNLSLATGDEPDAVAENRRRLVDGLEVPEPALPAQVHGAKLVRVGPSRAGTGFAAPGDAIPGADGLFTSSPRVALGVLTADCLPLVLAAPAAGRVAVVHAGWRGIAAGILQRSVERFDDPAELRASIGPTIGPCHYEVGEDVALAVAAASEAGARTRREGSSLRLDLVATARAALRALGVRRIEDTGLCTACERRRFYSHRRDGAATGRQAAVAMRVG